MRQALDQFFGARTIAVIGAANDAAHRGRAVLWNLIKNPFGGTVYPVTANLSAVLGVRAYKSLAAIPERVQLAVIADPDEVMSGLTACIETGVKSVIVTGFGRALPDETRRDLAAAKVRLLGPRSLGIMRPSSGLNATFAPVMARSGSVALVTQSAGVCTSLLEWGVASGVGFSAVITLGKMADVGWAEVLDWLGSDARTHSIVLHLDSIGDARAFLSAAREVALDKPIVLMKGGPLATGVFDAAMRRVGVVRVADLHDIFTVTEALARQPRPQGPRLGVVTNSGGPGVLAGNALRLGSAQSAADGSPEPVDLTEAATPGAYEAAVNDALRHPDVDGVLVIQTPQATSDRVEVARGLARVPKSTVKPVLACWMGAPGESEAILAKAGIPTFAFPEAAARAFSYMWRYTYNLRSLYETPSVAGDEPALTEEARATVATAWNGGRTELTAAECRLVLAAYGMELNDGGAELRLSSEEDPEFGPVLRLDPAGMFAQPPMFALPPLNGTLARRFFQQSAPYGALCGKGVEGVLIRFAQLVLEQTGIAEISLSLGVAGSTVSITGVSARLRDERRAMKPAIRPYPSEYVSNLRLRDGAELTLRPIRPEDEPAVARFHATLSDQSVYLRYFTPLSLEHRVRHERLTRVCFIDYDRQMAFVAQPVGSEEVVGVGRLIKDTDRTSAELAGVVSDAWQGRGLGQALVRKLLVFAREERLKRIVAYVLAANVNMQRLLEREGFVFEEYDGPQMMEGRLEL